MINKKILFMVLIALLMMAIMRSGNSIAISEEEMRAVIRCSSWAMQMIGIALFWFGGKAYMRGKSEEDARMMRKSLSVMIIGMLAFGVAAFVIPSFI